MTDDRRYSEAELHAIFERAAKRQEEAQRAEAASQAGLTLGELQRIGQASGIAPEHVAEAAAELAARSTHAPDTILGMPPEIRRTRTLAAPVTDEAWERMVAELRQTFGQAGVAGKVGRVREWATTTEEAKMPIRVSVVPGEAGTQVSVEQGIVRKRKEAREIVIAIPVLVVALFVFVLLGDLPPHYLWLLPGVVGISGGALAGGNWFWLHRHVNRQERTFDALLDRIELIARTTEPEPERAAATPDVSRHDPLGLDTLPEEDERTGTPERRRTRS
jgi:hypothetical protein